MKVCRIDNNIGVPGNQNIFNDTAGNPGYMYFTDPTDNPDSHPWKNGRRTNRKEDTRRT